MKQLLVTLSTLTILTLTSSTTINSTVNNGTVTNRLSTNETPTSLFNNQYRYLSNSDWITNQSLIDHKFYSYNTSALKPYNFNDKLNTFLVDNAGNLVYNPKVIVPFNSKIDVENARQQMITNCKVTTIKNDYNPYSKSQYSDSYFNGDNQKWEYMQQGGLEKHIDISQQYAANKVEYNNNLSENLGLYYIAKAARENKITETVADNLAIYFISQSSLKGQISENLTTKIIELIIHNENVYNFIYNIHININDKNYSLNYIFNEDIINNDHQLVKIYYNKWDDNSNISNNVNYSWTNQCGFANDNKKSKQYIILNNWKKYACDWNTFITKYPSFNFDNNSKFIVNTAGGTSDSINLTNKILTKSILNVNTSFFKIHTYYGGSVISRFPVSTVELTANLNIWHDDTNIYFQWFLKINIKNSGIVSNFSCILNNVVFNNIIN